MIGPEPTLHAVQPSEYERDVTFLRERGCMCPLRIDTGSGNTIQRAIPATGCEVTGERVICPKRLQS